MSEIEEFLRRAAAMRAQQAQQGQRARQSPQSRTAPVVPARAIRTEEVIDAEIIEADQVSGDDVAREVERHLDTREFQRRTSRFAENVRAADDVIEAHLHEAFEHRLGQLGASTSAADDSTLDAEEAAAAITKQAVSQRWDLRTQLQNPTNIRNAIIMSELLNPPAHRW